MFDGAARESEELRRSREGREEGDGRWEMVAKVAKVANVCGEGGEQERMADGDACLVALALRVGRLPHHRPAAAAAARCCPWKTDAGAHSSTLTAHIGTMTRHFTHQ